MPPPRIDLLWAAVTSGRDDPRPDADLLTRFLDEQDQVAFESLLARHTPAVRAACRGWLRSAADIDDAAQATFLVLVQRGGSIRDRAALGPWLCRVATNVARRLSRQQSTFRGLPEDVPGPARPEVDDLHDLLAEEVVRLPEKYRLPVQLCYSAGMTTVEAAQYLGWPKGTLLTRLAWARKRLQTSLGRRGVSPAVFAGLTGTAVPTVTRQWLGVTARAARNLLAGQSPADAGVSARTVSLTEGVVRAMTWNRFKYFALATLLTMGVVGLGLHLVSASDGPAKTRQTRFDSPEGRATQKSPDDRDDPATVADSKQPGKAEPRASRRREAVIRLPRGSFVKEVDAKPYGSGRLTWTYEEEKVRGLIEGSVLGFEFELTTEAEYSMSSNGTIYGLLTHVRLEHLRLPEGKEYQELKPYVGLWSAAEPLVNEVLEDLPFSYRFRQHGDRLTISNFRILLSGPNPLGKVGGLMAGNNDSLAYVSYFQALGTALEGTYTADDGKEKRGLKVRPFLKPRGRSDDRRNR
jgi:RNA polymerase sigma factor (sigma-70 family)